MLPRKGTASTVQLVIASTFNSPFNHRARPSEPAPEHDHQDVITRFNAAAAICFVERHSDRGGGCVAVFVKIHIKLLERNAESISNCFDDSQIRLMRNYTRNVLDA